MTTGTATPPSAPTVRLDSAPSGSAATKSKRLNLGVAGWLAAGWLGLLLILAVLAPVLPIPDPNTSFAEIARKGPSAGHLLGGDTIGRDLLSRIIYGTRASFAVGFGSIAFGFIVGGIIGLMAGFFRGKVDGILTPLMNILLAIPQFILALSLVNVFASGGEVTSARRLVVLIVGLGVVSVPLLGRITRANTLAWSEREFVLAARAMGAKNWRIMLRDVLPNVLPSMIAIGLLGVGIAIVAEGGLALFGVGVQSPTPSWGNIISEGQSQMRNAPHIVVATSVVLFLTVMALNFLGDLISQRFGVKESAL
ncbi:MAG: ABC transporter permease [Microthrixaceae bacterium]